MVFYVCYFNSIVIIGEFKQVLDKFKQAVFLLFQHFITKSVINFDELLIVAK